MLCFKWLLFSFLVTIPVNASGGEKKTINKAKHSSSKSSKAKKRWMHTYPSGYLQQDVCCSAGEHMSNPYGEQPFGGPPDPLGYGFQGYKDNYQDDLKLGKTPYQTYDMNPTYSQDVSSYLKPGIGDYPSDMPNTILPGVMNGNMKQSTYDPMANIGMPINVKQKPVASKFSPALAQLAQMAMDDAALNPNALHKPTTEVSADLPTNVQPDATELELNKPTGHKVEATSISGVEALETKDDAKTTAKVEGKPDGEETFKVESSVSKLKEGEKVEGAMDGEKDKSMKDENKEEESKTYEAIKGKEKEGTKSETTTENVKSSKQKTQTEQLTNDSTVHKLDPAMHLLTGARRQSWENQLADAAGHIGLPPVTSPDMLEGNDNIESNDDKDTSEETEKTPSKVKAKLVSSLRQALLENVKEMMSNKNTADKESEGVEEITKVDKDEKQTKQFSDDVNQANEEGAEASVAEDPANEMLEENLMKIDKRKLVRLLATLMRKNQDKESDYQEEETVASQVGKLHNDGLTKWAQESETGRVKVHKGLKHFMFDHDPYANIGSSDPNNNDSGKTKHFVHSSKDEEAISKAKQNADSQEDRDENRKKVAEAMAEKQEKEEKEAENAKAEENREAKMANNKVEENKEDSGEENKEESEQSNVEAEVELEKQELKKLKALEKAEKEKEIQLKASNAVLANKNKQEEAAADEGREYESGDDDGSKKPSKQKIHMMSADLVQAIANHFQTQNKEKYQQTDDEEQNENTGEEAKEGNKEETESKKEEDILKNKEATKESVKEMEGESKEKENSKETKADDDAINVQTLLEHMKQSLLNASKNKNRNAKEKDTTKQVEKSGKRRKNLYDDAYAQIGSQDVNVKRSKKFVNKPKTLSRVKKHHVHKKH